MKKIKILILTGLILTGISCKNNKEVKTVTTFTNEKVNHSDENTIIISNAQFKANDMSLGQVKIDTFYQKITAQGILDVPPSNKAVVSSFMPGQIKNIKLIVGDKVRKGQLLVQISNPNYIKLQQDYLHAKQNVDYLKQDYDRQQKLVTEKIVSQKRWQNAQRAYLNAKARYNALREQLKILHINTNRVENGHLTATVNIYAPISGYITKLFVTEGSALNENSKIMEIINNDHTHLELQVFEKDIMKLKKGQEISYKVPGLENNKYKGKVKLIGREINPKTRSILVHGHLEEQHPPFISGVYVEAKIYIGTHSGNAVPATAIIKNDDKLYILKLIQKDEKTIEFQKIPVQVLEEEEGITRINSNQIQAGDTILQKGGFFLVGTETGGGHSH